MGAPERPNSLTGVDGRSDLASLIFLRWQLRQEMRPVARDDAAHLGIDGLNGVEVLKLLPDFFQLLRLQRASMKELDWHFASQCRSHLPIFGRAFPNKFPLLPTHRPCLGPPSSTILSCLPTSSCGPKQLRKKSGHNPEEMRRGDVGDGG